MYRKPHFSIYDTKAHRFASRTTCPECKVLNHQSELLGKTV